MPKITTRSPTPIWGAASPAPLRSRIVSRISASRFSSAGVPNSRTGSATARSRGSPIFKTSRIAMIANMKLLVLRFQGSSCPLSGGLSHQLDLAAEVIDSSNQAQDHLFAVTMREMGGAEVLVLDTVFQHVVSGREHGG